MRFVHSKGMRHPHNSSRIDQAGNLGGDVMRCCTNQGGGSCYTYIDLERMQRGRMPGNLITIDAEYGDASRTQ
jgi:hypothetical protein